MADAEVKTGDLQKALKNSQAENSRITSLLSESRRKESGLEAALEQEKRRPPRVVEKEVRVGPPKMSADVIIKSVSVQSTKENGKAWDVNAGAPDLKVYIGQNGLFGDGYTTEVKHDTTYASFDKKSIRVTEGDTITVTVYDEDVNIGDVVGTYEKEITRYTLMDRRADWKFGQVISLQLEFQP